MPTVTEFERRPAPGVGVELRAQSDGIVRLTGYASVTSVQYPVRDYIEEIAPGAFKRTLASKPDVPLLVNHEGLPLARTTSGTLRLSEDDRGLKVDAELDAEDPDVQSLARKMRRGDLDQMSFAFLVVDSDWSRDFDYRLITEVDLDRGDVAVVTHGASPTTSASIRAMAMAAAGCQDPTRRVAPPWPSNAELRMRLRTTRDR